VEIEGDMKKICKLVVFGLVAAAAPSAIHAQSSNVESKFCAGHDAGIGEIRASILDERTFLKAYGASDWALMDGRSLLPGAPGDSSLERKAIVAFLPAELVDENGNKRIPDARGRFLRMNNVGAQGEARDPNDNRSIGSLQMHEIEKHKHQSIFTNHNNTPKHTDRSTHEFGRVSGWKDTTETGGDETRPSNISVYYYIRIHKTEGLSCE